MFANTLSSEGYKLIHIDLPYADFYVSFEDISGDTVKGRGVEGSLLGNPQQVCDEERNTGMALYLDGNLQALRFPNPDGQCFANLDLCPKGHTIAMWIKLGSKPECEGKLYIISNSFMSVTRKKSGSLLFICQAQHLKWYIRLPKSKYLLNQWYHWSIIWHENKGLFLYINGILFKSDIAPEQYIIDVYEFSLLFGIKDGQGSVCNYAKLTLDEILIWQKLKSSIFISGVYLQY